MTQGALATIMPNVDSPNPLKRKIIARVIALIMLYASSICLEALVVSTKRKKLSSVSRLSAIRMISGFKTVSDKSTLVLARLTAMDILTDRIRRYKYVVWRNHDELETSERRIERVP